MSLAAACCFGRVAARDGRGGRLLCGVLLVCGLLGGLGAPPASAQDSTVVLTDVGVHRDSLDAFGPQPFRLRPFVIPGSETITLDRVRLDTTEYRLDAATGRLWLRPKRPVGTRDTVVATYRTLPLAPGPVARRRVRARPPGGDAPSTRAAPQALSDTSASPDTSGVVFVEETAAADAPRFDPFEGVTLERSGSITRGVTGGSNRDATIESGLRLQLQGEIADDVRVRAVLTDENTPIQPEGTTQRLDDFDRVFVEIDAPQGTARLGDVDVTFDGSTFGRFSRRLQGASLSSDVLGAAAGIHEGRATVVGAVSRGIYRTQDVDPIDGVQGPYRLEGQNGERLIVVVAGSERVFLDGERLERGRTRDYVIDYARGEIAFTANRLITADRRITVEFQYTTSQFTRTLIGAQASAGAWADRDGASRLSVGATVLREADGDDFQAAFNLSPEDSLRLVRSGDDPVARSGAERVAFDPEAPFVSYRREVVSTPSGPDTAFVALDAAPEPGTPVFRVRFSRVGEGQGRYRRAGRQQNGILYEYVGPGGGAYAPVEPIPQPKRQQLLDLTGSLEPVRGVTVFGEVARSLNDRNRLSSLDAADDRDGAYVAGLRVDPVALEAGRTALGTLSGAVQRTRRGRHFTAFDPTRPIEFGRRWNVSRSGSDLSGALQGTGDETVDEASLAWTGGASRVEASGGRLTVGDAFEAWRRAGRVQVGEAGVPRVDVRATYVTSTDRVGGVDGAWFREAGTIRQPLAGGRLEPRLAVDVERRRQRARGTDSLTAESFAFVEVRPGLRYRTGALRADAAVELRTEDEALGGVWRDAATAWTTEAELAVDPRAPVTVRLKGGYRTRRFTDAFRVQAGREDTESVILQFDGDVQPWNRAVDVRLFYDALTERTPTLQEVYVRTGAELGQFVWTDTNGDGLQQIDEFVPETTPNEGEYVQSFVPSDTLESVVSLQSRLRVQVDPARIWRRADAWWKQALTRVATRTTVEVDEESRSDALLKLYTLHQTRFRDAGTTLDGTLRLAQDVQLFRASPVGGLDFTWTQSRGLTERAAGQERRFVNAWEAEGRWTPADRWTLRLAGSVQTDRSRSEAFAGSRSYDIDSRAVRPEVSVRPSRAVQVTAGAALARKDDAVGGRSAAVTKLPARLEWSRPGRFQIRLNAEVARVDLTGDAVGLAQFELTDGRGPGTSYLWGAQGRWVLNEYLRATLAYDARAPADAATIHTFRAQLSATF